MAEDRTAMIDWMLGEWREEGPPIAILEGFSGVGKSHLAAQLKRAWGPRSVRTTLADGMSSDDLLLSLAGDLQQVTLEADLSDLADFEDMLVKCLRTDFLIVIDNFEVLLDELSGRLPPGLSNLFEKIARSSGPGRLLLVTKRSPEHTRWVGESTIRTLQPPGRAEALELLVNMLEQRGLIDDNVPSEMLPEVVDWLGRNPRAIRAFVTCLRTESFEELIAIDEEAWVLRDVSHSQTFVRHLEREFWNRTLRHLDPGALSLVESLSVLRRPFRHDAIAAMSESPQWEPQREKLVSWFLMDRSLNYFAVNPVVKQLCLIDHEPERKHRLHLHRRAASYFEKKIGAQSGRALSRGSANFVEARFHLAQAGMFTEVETLAHRFRRILQNNFMRLSEVPINTNTARQYIPALTGALSETDNPLPEMRELLVRLLIFRDAPDDGVMALKHAVLGTRASRSTWFWETRVALAAEHDFPIGVSAAVDQIHQRGHADLISRVVCRAAEELYLGNRTDLALGALRNALTSLEGEPLVYIWSRLAFILHRVGQSDDAILALLEGYEALSGRTSIATRLFEEAAFIAFGRRDSEALSRVLACERGTDSLAQGRRVLAKVLSAQLLERYADAAEMALEAGEYGAVAAQRAFCLIASGEPQRASACLDGRRGIRGLTELWLSGVAGLANGDFGIYRAAMEALAHDVPELQTEAVDGTTWLRLWDRVPIRIGRYPAFYHPHLPTSMTGLENRVSIGPVARPVLRESQLLAAGAIFAGADGTSGDHPVVAASDVDPDQNEELETHGVGVVTIISEETRAVRDWLLTGTHFAESRGVGGRYFYRARMPLSTGSVTVVATQAVDQGQTSATSAVNALHSVAVPRLTVLLGIAGGIHSDVGLGDVVIGTDVIDYGPAALTPSGPRHRGSSFKPPLQVKTALNHFFSMKGDEIVSDASSDAVAIGRKSFTLSRGPIGTGYAVIKYRDAEVRKWLLDYNEKTLVVETESEGVARAFYEAGERADIDGFVVLRGVSDHADEAKDDRWKLAASRNAVRALELLLVALSDEFREAEE